MLLKGKKEDRQNVQKNNEKINEINLKSKKNTVRVIIARWFIVAILLIMTTYAWFTSQKDITLSNLRGTVEVAENMEISLDAKMWYRKIDLSEMTGDKTALQMAVLSRNMVSPYTAPNIEPVELLPVSTVGSVGSIYVPFYKGTARTKELTSLNDVEECKEINIANNREGIDSGYFAFDIYIKNTSRDGEPDILQLNLNSAVQVLQKEIEKTFVSNGVTVTRKYVGQEFSGIQNTIRVGLALYEDTITSMAMQKDVLDATKDSKIINFAIWEPNAPHHVQYIVDNNNKLIGAGAATFENGDALDTYALNSNSIVEPAKIENVYNTDDTKLSKQVTLQTQMSNTTEGEEDYRILSNDGNPWDLKDIEGNAFTIESNKISRLRVYVWMEGQDVDCINLASFGGGIEMDLGLTKDNEVGEVLNDTDDDSEPADNTVQNN